MREIKTVSIIGLGALGVLFGHQIQKNAGDYELKIIADKSRIERYRKESIYSNGELCEFHYVTPEEKTTHSDLIIFTVKYSGLEQAIKDVRSQVGEKTIIISALNGISSEGIIGRTYGMDKIVYCVAQKMDAVKVGNQLNYVHMGELCIGDIEPGVISEKTESVARFFEKAKVPYDIDKEMKKRMWGKFMLNVGINQTVAVYGQSFRDVQKEGPVREIMISAMKEVIRLSECEGINLGEADLKYWLDIADTLGPDSMPSMRQDVVAKRPSELELFAGTVLELGTKYGIETPVNKDLYDKMKELESAY